MSDRVEWFSVAIPANTPKASPVTTLCTFRQGEVIEIDVIVPPGPKGTVGFYVAAGGSQYLPRTAGSYVVADGVYLQWPQKNAINSGAWSIVAYNTDVNIHTIEFGFLVDEVGPDQTTSGSVIGSSSAQLSATVSQLAGIGTAPVDPLSPDALIASLPAGS
jgi:hypothetical protein